MCGRSAKTNTYYPRRLFFSISRPRGTKRKALDNAQLLSPVLGKIIECLGKGRDYLQPQVDLARAVIQETGGSDVLNMLSSLGTDAKWSSNTERDFHSWLSGSYGMKLKPYLLPLPLELKKRLGVEALDVPILFPHELFGAVYDAGPEQFKKTMLGPDGAAGVRIFWERSKDESWFQRISPAKRRKLNSTVPMYIHVDGAQVGKNQNMEVDIYSVSSALSQGDAYDTKLLCAIVPTVFMPTTEIKKLVNSQMASMFGFSFRQKVYPSKGMFDDSFKMYSHRYNIRGHEIAGGWQMMAVGMKHDAKARKLCHNFDRFWKTTCCCDMCDAQRSTKAADPKMLFGNFAQTAPHMQTQITHEEYMANTDPEDVSPWLAELPELDRRRILWDLMHNLFLGVMLWVCGSVIWDLLDRRDITGLTDDEALKKLYIECREFCKQHKIVPPSSIFTMNLIGKGTPDKNRHAFPCLSAGVRAMHAKHIFMFLAHKCQTLTNSPHKRLRALMMWALADYIHTIDHAGFWMHRHERDRAHHSGSLFLMCYQKLAEQAGDDGKPNWKIVPKFHYFQHQIEGLLLSAANPRRQHCFMDEDFMGKISRLVAKCHINSCMLRALQRYILYIAWRWYIAKVA